MEVDSASLCPPSPREGHDDERGAVERLYGCSHSNQQKLIMQTTWVLPLEIKETKNRWAGGEFEDWPLYTVVTLSGGPVGPRLLKGVEGLDIREWGPFEDHQDAVRLKAILTAHIENWPNRRRK